MSRNKMENYMFNDPLDMASQNSVVLDAISLNTTPNSRAQSCSFDLNNQNQIMAGYPLLSTLQEHFSDAHADLRMTNRVGFLDSGALFSSVGRNAIRDASIGSSHLASNTEFEEQLVGGTPISAASIATLLATRSDAQENLNHIRNSAASIHPLEVLRTYVSNDCSNASNSSFANSMNCGYAEVLGNMNNSKWSFELGGKTPVSSGFQPVSPIGNLDLNGWLSSNSANVSTDHPYASSELSNELSLSLATSWPSVIGGSTLQDQCSVTHLCLNETGLGSEQTSCNSKELSLSFGSYKPGQFSQLISGSRYLHVIQEILAQIASYSLENLDQTSYATGKNGAGANKPFSSGWPSQKRASPTASDGFPDVDGTFEVQTEPAMQRQAVEAKKAQLLTLLQVVDDRYNQCVDEIHTVISAFHAATELDPQIHARFSLQTISFLYKNLRDRISNQILAMGAHFDKDNERSFETSFIQKQWALQQLKRKDHQLWRPQRGLPERSVSVLRAWMFQNFLHPYPKDSEKQLLAVKSGLTRSQVSNWFINARVRLWKPMIEEMYFEMNRRKAQWNEKGTDSSHRSNISIDEV